MKVITRLSMGMKLKKKTEERKLKEEN